MYPAKRSLKKAFALLLATTLSTSATVAQQQAQPVRNAVEVLVNDAPITTFDIRQRLQLTLARSGGVQTEEQFIRLREQVIESMIDEKLKLLQAAEFEFEVPQRDLDRFFADEARNYNRTSDQFEQVLAQIGSSKQSMTEQIKAEFSWSQIVQGRFGSNVSVSDEEVESFIARKQAQKGQYEFRLAEIVLRVSNPAQEAQVKDTADRLVAQLRQGAEFRDLARQLSQSPTSSAGGDMGWITGSDLDPPIAAALEGANAGDILDPIRTTGSYKVIAFVDRRKILEADPLDEALVMKQLFVPKAALDTDPSIGTKFRSDVEPLVGTTVSCESVAGMATEMGITAGVDLSPLTLKMLRPDLRAQLVSLGIGEVSAYQENEDGHRVFVLCERRAPVAPTMDFDRIYSSIENTRLEMMGRRYLRDLRREAIIDYLN